MDYAETYHTGINSHTRKTKATAGSSAVSRVRCMDATDKRRKRTKQRQAEIRTRRNVTDGFLNTSFLPRLAEQEYLKPQCSVECDFQDALTELTNCFGLDRMELERKDYPYNLATALNQVRKALKDKHADCQTIRLAEHEGRVLFTRMEGFDTGMTLYYIPTVPLYHLLKDTHRKRTAELLLSVFAYLYQVVDVAYYRDQGSYLHYMYEFIYESDSDSDDEIDSDFIREHAQSLAIGDFMKRKIKNHHNLERFKLRLDSFWSDDHFDSNCYAIATQFYELYKDYPKRTIHDNIRRMEYDDEQQGVYVAIDNYLSFWANNNGMVSDMLFDFVNSELQEYCAIDEPVRYVPLDGRAVNGNDFDFEKRIFKLIDELIWLLNDYGL